MTLAVLLGWLRRVPAWVWIALLLMGVGWYYGKAQFDAGQADVQARWDKARERGKAEVARLKEEAGKVTVRVETKYIDRVKTIREKGETIVQKVPVYISRDLPELPGAWRVLHDSASQGSVPGSAEFTDAAPVAPQDAASTVTANYAICCRINQQR